MDEPRTCNFATVEDLLKAQGRVLNRQMFISFLGVAIFAFIFIRWVVTEEVTFLVLSALLGPITLVIFVSSMKNTEEFARNKEKLSTQVLKDRIELCILVGNHTPPNASQLRFFPLDKHPVTRYTPLQWWTDEKVLEVVDREIYKEVEVYKETLDPWIASKYEDSFLIKVDKVFNDLYSLEDVGLVESIERLRSDDDL